MVKKEKKENDESKEKIRELGFVAALMMYSFQDTRIGANNQVRDVVRRINENISRGTPEDKKEGRDYSKKYSDSKLEGIKNKMFEDGKIGRDERQFLDALFTILREVSKIERKYHALMKTYVANEPIWTKYLIHVRGIGHVLASNLIAKLGHCEKFDTVSKLWKYCGFHIVCPVCTEEREDFRGNMRKFPVVGNDSGHCPKCGRPCVASKRQTGKSLDHNPQRRVLGFKIGDSLITNKSKIYYDEYKNEKLRQLERQHNPGELQEMYAPWYKSEKTNPYKEDSLFLRPDHAHARALRKIAKLFLSHYWVVTRSLAGLNIRKPYVEEKKGHTSIITWRDVIRANDADPDTVLADVG
jgi:hypothetical protein